MRDVPLWCGAMITVIVGAVLIDAGLRDLAGWVIAVGVALLCYWFWKHVLGGSRR